ncbi:ADP-ribose pyrophosphatase [Aciduliprofundum sp. MAR08-339]|uniref:NUDIX domain-containing protein n=1 Tax=Aciduliprofundum sp. (strain MAR08-339) TaxID=673860 RepID=UPI0002A48632|nr:ADP-ribose pyrophosphatase [Aciduliprofundum sp. MAR08-339]
MMIVVVVPVRDGKFLMVYNPKRGWEFPGGKVEENESPEAAAVREAWEEAGLVLENMRIVEEGSDMIVFAADVKDIKGGEMEYALFSKLPEKLAFPREESLRFLRRLHINT